MRDVFAFRPHHHRDWMADQTVSMMSFCARGIFLALQDSQWEAGSLPADPEDCRAILRATPEEWSQFERFLDRCFPLCEDGLRRNETVTKDRESVTQMVEQRRTAGKRSGSSRSSKQHTSSEQEANGDVNDTATKRQRDVNETSTGSERNANNTNTNTKIDITPSLTGADARGPAPPDHRTRLSEQLWPLWEKFLRHRTERGQAVGIQEADMLLTDLETWPEDDVRSAIEFAIKSGHKKLIKPSERRYDTGSGAAKPPGESPPGRKATLSIHEVTEIALAAAGGEA